MIEKLSDEILENISGGMDENSGELVKEEYICQKCGKKYTRSHLAGSCWMFQDATIYCDECWKEVHGNDK